MSEPMEICEGIYTEIEYYWKRSSGSWKSPATGQECWWEYFVIFSGFNGGGGVWFEERSRWNNSVENMFSHPRTLGYQESRELIAQVKANLEKGVVHG